MLDGCVFIVLTHQCQVACFQLLMTILPLIAQKIVASFTCTTIPIPDEVHGLQRSQSFGQKPPSEA